MRQTFLSEPRGVQIPRFAVMACNALGGHPPLLSPESEQVSGSVRPIQSFSFCRIYTGEEGEGRTRPEGGLCNSLFSPLERVTWDPWNASWRSCCQSSWTKSSAAGGEGVGGEKRKGAVFYLMSVAAPSPQCLAHGEYSETGPSTKTDGKLHPEFSLSSGRAPLDCSHQSPCLCTSRGT